MNTFNSENTQPGRLIKAPENFLAPEDIGRVQDDAKSGRRGFLRRAFAAAGAAVAVPVMAQSNPAPEGGGDPNILNLPAHSRGLGQSVATDGYGKPSQYESNVQRRPSPGLTQTA